MVVLQFDATGGDYGPVAVDNVTVTIGDDDEPGLTVSSPSLNVAEGGRATYSVQLDRQPREAVTVTVEVPVGTDISVSPARFTLDADDWAQGVGQTVTVTAAEDADAVADGPVTLEHLADGRHSADLGVTITDNDMVGVTVNPTPQLTVREGDGEVFTVVLNTEPTGDVVVAMTGDLGETDLTVTPTSLTFTTANWNVAQPVAVKAGRDNDALPDPPVDLKFVVTGADYHGLRVEDLKIAIIEDDAPGVKVSVPTVTVVEGGQSEYQVWLDKSPYGEVSVVLAWPRGTDLSISPATLTFGPNNWEQAHAQTVTLTGREDGDAVADDPVTILHSVDGTDSVQVTVEIVEKDEVGVTVSRREVRVKEGGSEVFTVVLDTEPTGDVAVAMTVDLGETDLTVTPMSLTFTTANWNVAREVTVAAVEDEDVVQDRMVMLVYTVTGADYTGVQVDPVEVEIEEVDHVTAAEDRFVKRNLKRAVAATVANVTKNIGVRFSGAGGGQTTLTLGGQRVPIGPVMASFVGVDTVWDPGLFAEDGVEGRTRSLTGVDLWRASEFQVSLGAAEQGLQPLDFSNWTIWGRGDIALFDSKGSDEGRYNTDLRAAYLGVDKWLNQRWLGGVATSRIHVDSEYGLDSGGGQLKLTMTSIHPYLRYSPDASNEWWFILGAGVGEIENKREGLLEPEFSRAHVYMGATGVRRGLTTWGTQNVDLALVGDLGFGYVEGQSDTDDQSIDNLALESLRLRLGLSGSYTFEIAEQQTATPFIEVAGRFDGGEGDSDFGLEFSGGLSYAHPASGFGLELRGNVLGLYTDRSYREYGASVTASLTPQAGGEGLSLAVTPRIGRQTGGFDMLLREDPFALTDGSSDPAAISFDARVGYGVSIPELKGMLTPFGEVRLWDGDGRRMRAGVRFGRTGLVNGGFSMEIFGDQNSTDGDAEHRIGLVGRYRF